MTSEPAPFVASLPDSLATIAVRERAWLRRADRGRLCALGAVGFALWLLAVLFRALESLPPDSGEAVTPGAIAGLAVFLALFVGLPLLFAWRIGTAGVWMGREGIVVRGPLRTWTIPLEEARAFNPGMQPGYGPNGYLMPDADARRRPARRDMGARQGGVGLALRPVPSVERSAMSSTRCFGASKRERGLQSARDSGSGVGRL